MNFKAIEIINELNIAFTKLEAKNDKILKDTSNVVTKLKNKMTILQNECEKAIDKIINTSLPNIAKKYKETLNSYKGKERKTIYHFYDKNGETKGFDDAQQQEFIKYSLKTNKDIVKDYTVRMEELMEEKRLLENSVIQLKADSTILKSGILDDQKKVNSTRSLNNDLMLAHVVLKQEHDELIARRFTAFLNVFIFRSCIVVWRRFFLFERALLVSCFAKIDIQIIGTCVLVIFGQF